MSLKNRLTSFFSGRKNEDTRIIEKIWIFREPRLNESVLKDVQFQYSESATPLEVANLSCSGIAFKNVQTPASLSPGSMIRGTLHVLQDDIEVSATVVRIDDFVIACSFTMKTSHIDRVLRKYFQIEIAAMKMNPMNPDHLAPSSEGTPHCLNGDLDHKLYFLETDGEIHYFELSFQGNDIEATKGNPLKVRRIFSDHSRTDLKYQASSERLEDPSQTQIDQALKEASRFIFHMERLESKFRTELLRALEAKKL